MGFRAWGERYGITTLEEYFETPRPVIRKERAIAQISNL